MSRTKLLNIVGIKDPHINISHLNPHRTDYKKDLGGKFNYISSYVEKNDIDLVLFTGDVLCKNDSKQWAFKRNYIKVRNWFDDYVDYQSKLYTVFGNHDYLDGDYNNKNDTVLGELIKLKKITSLTKKPKIINKVAIFGLDYKHEVETLLYDLNDIYKDVIDLKKSGEVELVILVSHTYILPKDDLNPIFRDTVHLTYEFLATNYPLIDIQLLGHLHKKVDLKKINKTTFVNPYNLMRVKRDEDVKTNKHEPMISDIRIYDDYTFDVEYVTLPYTPYDKAFKKDITETIDDNAKHKISFDFDLDQFSNKPISDDELLDLIIEKRNLDPDIKDLFKEYYR